MAFLISLVLAGGAVATGMAVRRKPKLPLVSLIVFVIVELLLGDAATAYLGRNATPEGLERVRVAFAA